MIIISVDLEFVQAAAEAKEADEAAKEMGLTEGSEDQLKSMLMKRNQDRAKEMNSFFDELEAKYSKPKKQGKKEVSKKKKK